MNDLAAIAFVVGLAAFVPSIAFTIWIAWCFARTVMALRKADRALCEINQIRRDDLIIHVRIPPEIKV